MVTPPGASPLSRLAAALRRDLSGLAAAVGHRRPPRPGLYSWRLRLPGGRRRIHLRIQEDGSGLLLVDVTDVVHLNATAAGIARLALDGIPPGQAQRMVRRWFRGAGPQVAEEVAAIYGLIDQLKRPRGGCPTCALQSCGRRPLFSFAPQAPYKADLALTYGCNNACGHCYNEPGRQRRSLSFAGWRRVLRHLVRIGVPHVVFTGGEPTLIEWLPQLVRYAERLGLVTGLNTNGRRLAEPAYTRRLARAGLSHLQITLLSSRPDVHDQLTATRSFHQTVAGIRQAIAAGLHTITNTTLTRQNIDHAEEIVDLVKRLGVRTFAVNGIIRAGRGRAYRDGLREDQLAPVLVRLRQRAAELGLRMLWYTPTPYCRLSPLELDLGPRRCNAAEYSICIEPNGDVLPCQSYYRPAGNILQQPWEEIWNSPLFLTFRRRVADPRGCGLPLECWDCPDLELCGGGCRLAREFAEQASGAEPAAESPAGGDPPWPSSRGPTGLEAVRQPVCHTAHCRGVRR